MRSKLNLLYALVIGFLMQIDLSAQNAKAYVPNERSNTVSIIDVGTDTVVTTISVQGGRPRGLAVTADGRFLYTANANTSNVSVIDLNTKKVVALVVLSHQRQRVLHFNVTQHPTALWTAQQMTEAFPEDTFPRYSLRDRDQVYGEAFRHRTQAMNLTEVLTAPQSPWQSPFVERLIGSVRRECLDHLIVLGKDTCGTF